MSQQRTFLVIALAAGLLPACSESDPLGITAGSAELQAAAQASAAAHTPPDVAGAWNWSSVEVLRMPRWFVEALGPVLGITPEGENTHARCESSGTMVLAQTDAAFLGTATRTVNACLTQGGQAFQQMGSAIQVSDGVISGRNLRFSFHTALVRPCPHSAVVSDFQSGVAAALGGTGHCIIPGHPQSDSPLPLDPPPGGTSTTVSWQAWRP